MPEYQAQYDTVLNTGKGPDLVKAGELRTFDGKAPESKIKGKVLWKSTEAPKVSKPAKSAKA